MKAPPTTTLKSLPRGLPPQVAAASLAATLHHARRRRVRRQTCQVCAAMLVGCAAALGLQSMGCGSIAETEAPGLLTQKARAPHPASPDRHPGSPKADIPLTAAESTYPLQISSGDSPPPGAVPQDLSGHPDLPPAPPASSFLLVRTGPAEIIHTRPEPAAPPSAAPAAGCTLITTRSIPSPMIITTARTVAPQSIATADRAQSPVTATDSDLFALADGRPAALCRLASGDTRWFWLDGGSVH